MKIRFLLLFLFFTPFFAYSQVTIGSSIPPNNGALLDIKENENPTINANKGILLPRVSLTDIANLFPMFGDAENVSIDYNNSDKKAKEDAAHTGLVVYNVNTVDPHICPGTYVWLSDMWRRLPKPCYECLDSEVFLTGQSCAYTGRSLQFISGLSIDDPNMIVDKWTVAKEGSAETEISGEKSSVLNYTFPLGTTSPGKYYIKVYYKHSKLPDCVKSKMITVELFESIIQDYWAQNKGSKTYAIRATSHKRLAGHEIGAAETTAKFVKISYIKSGTTEEVTISTTSNDISSYTFPSEGTYYIKMYWEWPCNEGLDPTPPVK